MHYQYIIRITENIPSEDLVFVINGQLFLEILLLEIRSKTILFSSFKNKDKNNLEKKWIEDIQKLETGTIASDT